ncbi:MAG: ribosome assembly cofactor RimP [Bacteroidota bacterium]
MFREKVEALLQQALDRREDLFLIEVTVGGDNSIKIVLDGDKAVTLNDCMEVSRAVEHNLDREEQDFSLEVTSAGATAPLRLPRQYRKHVGRNLEVRTSEDAISGKLSEVGEDGITLTWKSREPKPVGKGKHTVQKTETISFATIQEAKVVLKF